MWRSLEMKNSLPCPFRTAIYRGHACIYLCSVSRRRKKKKKKKKTKQNLISDMWETVPYTTTRKEYIYSNFPGHYHRFTVITVKENMPGLSVMQHHLVAMNHHQKRYSCTQSTQVASVKKRKFSI